MREDPRARDRIADVFFDTFKELMSALDRPIAWNKHVQRNEFSRSGLTCPQCVKFYTDLFVVLENLPHRNPVFEGQRSVHESTDGPSNDSNTRPDNVGSYCECHNRIESLPACQRYQTHTSNHSDRGPDVGEQMAGICFESY